MEKKGQRHLRFLTAIKASHSQPPGHGWTERLFEELAKVELDGDDSRYPAVVNHFVDDLDRVLQERVIAAYGIRPANFLGHINCMTRGETPICEDRMPSSEYAANCSNDKLSRTLADLSRRLGLGADYQSQECWHMLSLLNIASGDMGQACKELERKVRMSTDSPRSHLAAHPAFLDLVRRGGLRAEVGVTEERLAEARKYLEKLNRDGPPKQKRSAVDWRELLSTFEQSALESEHLEEYTEYEPERFAEALKARRLRSPGAHPAEIETLEARLGKSLPPSYRSFLECSNGLILPFQYFDLWPALSVDWFINNEREWVEIWNEDDRPVPDDLYFQYGDNQDCVNLRVEYLKTALQISSTQEGDVLLLVPDVVFDNGEWEAWFFGNSRPGAVRYRSFDELMVDQVLVEPDY